MCWFRSLLFCYCYCLDVNTLNCDINYKRLMSLLTWVPTWFWFVYSLWDVLAQQFGWYPLMHSCLISQHHPLLLPQTYIWLSSGMLFVLTLGRVYRGTVSNLWMVLLQRRQLDRSSIGELKLRCWQSRGGFQMSHQLIYPAIKQYSGNKVGGGAINLHHFFPHRVMGKLICQTKHFRSSAWTCWGSISLHWTFCLT